MTPTGSPLRLLLVDDDRRDYELTRRLLASIYDGNCTLDWEPDGDRALGVLVTGGYDACLVDYHLGSGDGLEVIRGATAAGCPTPLILLTAFDTREVDLEAARAGATDFLAKGRTDASTVERSLRYAIQRARIVEELRRSRAQAEAAIRSQERFLAMISHELRTPLTPVVLALSSLLDGGEVGGELRATLEMALRNVQLEARLVDDLLDLARDQGGKLRIDPAVIDAHRAVRRAAEVCSEEATRAGLEVELDLRAAEPFVLADETRLVQIAWNLITNAARHAAGGRLEVRSFNERRAGGGGPGDLFVLEFRDDGRGLDGPSLARIFEPFQQSHDGSRALHGGLGLGLTISRVLAQAHGGSLRAVESSGGATFRLELAAAARPSQAAREGPPPPEAPAPEGLDILLLEDNRDTLRYLTLVLGRDHRVAPAARLSEAFEAFEGRRFDLVISDIELPDGTGLELMREVAGLGVPGIAMSGFGSGEDVERSLEAGFSMHLTKPITVLGLSEAIRKVVGAPSPADRTPTRTPIRDYPCQSGGSG